MIPKVRRSRCSRITMIAWLILIVIMYLLVCILLKFRHVVYNARWLEARREVIESYHLNQQTQLEAETSKRNMPACAVPKLNAFHQDVLVYMEERHAVCPLKRYGKVKDGVYIVKSKNIESVTLQYILRAMKDKELNKDNHVKLSEKIVLKKVETTGNYELKLEEDHFKVEMYVRGRYHVEYHSHFGNKNTKERKNRVKIKDMKSGLPLNVIMLMIDSQSNANFHRQLIKSMPLLLSDENTIIFKGHTIVADGTTGQLTAAFTGTHEKDLPESRRGFPNSDSCDRFDWIFKELDKAGYSTLFTETDPRYASFNYRLYGFRNPPTTFYTRAYWLGQMEFDFYHYCNYQYNLELLKEFTKSYENEAKFAYAAMGRVAHNDINMLQVCDDGIVDMIKFYKDLVRIDDTIFIIFADHGARTSSSSFRASFQGKLEERLPFFSMTVPPSFKRNYPKYFDAMKHNSKILTSPYDMYVTFKHLLSHPHLPEGDFVGQSLFTKINAQNRTCGNSGVLDHWCPCLDFIPVDKNTAEVIQIATKVIETINKRIKDIGQKHKLCAVLSLESIISAGILTPKKNVQQFVDTKRDDVCDSCDVVLDKKVDSESMKSYEVKFTVSPSHGRFEANAKLSGNKIIVDPNISRMNMYRSQPECIMDEYPHLRPFCYCVQKA